MLRRKKNVEAVFLLSEKVMDLGQVVGLPHRAEHPVEMIINYAESDSIVVCFSLPHWGLGCNSE